MPAHAATRGARPPAVPAAATWQLLLAATCCAALLCRISRATLLPALPACTRSKEIQSPRDYRVQALNVTVTKPALPPSLLEVVRENVSSAPAPAPTGTDYSVIA